MRFSLLKTNLGW